jgi:hypothetical protein
MIFFLHIPKTGGQTLATRIAAAFPPGRSYVLQSNITSAEELARLCAQHDFVEGHTAAGVLADAAGSPDIMMAVRDPIEQIISNYRHIRRDPALRLHKTAMAMPPVAFMERCADRIFNFQAKSFVKAFAGMDLLELAGGDDLWVMRHFETSLGRLRWLLPTEAIDQFGPLWALETNRALPLPTVEVNRAASDDVDAAALRGWLRERPERFALDSLLWARARARFAAWSYEVLSRWGGVPADESPMCAFRQGQARIWLGQGWHAPAQRGDGVTEWWSGPDFFSSVRVRPAGHRELRFEVAASLGVQLHKLRILHPDSRRILPLALRVLPGTSIGELRVTLDGLGEDERLLVHGPEDVHLLPDLPFALQTPRRGFATQNWRLE